MYINPASASQIALAKMFVGTWRPAHRAPSPAERPGFEKSPGGRTGPVRFLKRLLRSFRAPHSRVAKPVDPMSVIECAGRPYLIGAGTFLVAIYLDRNGMPMKPAGHGLGDLAPQTL